jgi:hypothetical protein
MAPEMVRCKNVGDDAYRDQYAGVSYWIEPGDNVLVPWAAACLWFGDPNVTDKPTMSLFDRREEIERLYLRLGCYDGDGSNRTQRFADNRPRFAVENLEGSRIVMLVDDLDGTQAQSRPEGKVDERVALASELDRMKQVQAELLQRLHTLEAGSESFDELPTDVPTRIPVDEEAR